MTDVNSVLSISVWSKNAKLADSFYGEIRVRASRVSVCVYVCAVRINSIARLQCHRLYIGRSICGYRSSARTCCSTTCRAVSTSSSSYS